MNLFLDLYAWKRTWNRLIDSYDKPDRDDLISIEKRIFENIKKEVEEESGDWLGLKSQNSLADFKVASCIFKSFKAYEEGKRRQGSFFTFRKLRTSQD